MKRTILSSRIGTTQAFVPAQLVLALALAFSSGAMAAPVGGTVAAGAVSISSAGSATTIVQTTPKAVINWQGFNVGSTESVRFVQPSSSSAVLNRVTSPGPTTIQGSIQANGQVFVINPNGILFGNGSSVNVGGLVASTLGITDSNFMAGIYKFNGNGAASVVNQGTITTNADGGYVALLGGNVGNDGVIAARMGSVVLAAGSAMTLDIAGDNLLNVTVDDGAVNALVRNGNLIKADGGQVILTTQGAGALLSTAVNNTGVIQAQAVQTVGGTIRLTADAGSGTVTAGGTLDVSGAGAGQKGGGVQILGKSVNLIGANINASGDSGGGQVLVGGNFNGAGPQPTSQTTTVDSATVINANAVRSGNGGRIALWSDGTTSVDGALSARGGAVSGNGGYIETSGNRVVLGPNYAIDMLAPGGLVGMWLLDPVNWTIATVGGDETPAQVTASLAGADRTITATNDIVVNDAVTWTTPQILTLNAGHDVKVNAAITGSTASAGIVLIAGNDVNVAAGAALTATALNTVIKMTATHDVVIAGAVTASGNGSLIKVIATNDINATAAITASQTGTLVDMSAGRDMAVGTVTTNGGGSTTLKANRNITASGLLRADTGTVTLIADNDGTGPGVSGGTVTFTGPSNVSAVNTIIRFNPVTYATTTTEIAAYVAKVVAGTTDIKAWVFALANDKVYDTTTAATLSFNGSPQTSLAVSLNGGSATFDNKNVGTSKAVTFTGYSVSGADSSKVALFTAAGTTAANITPAPLTVSATGTNKVYDGNTTDTVTLAATPLAGDTISVANAAANFVDKNVGNGKAVNVTGITVGGADGGNYSANTATTTVANITPLPLTVSATGTNKVYDGNTTDTVAVSGTNVIAGDAVTVANTAANFSDKNVGTAKTVTVTGITIAGADAGNYTAPTTTATTANITPLGLTINATGSNKGYDGTTTATVGLTDNRIAGDTFTTTPGAANYSSAAVGTNKTISVTGITAAGKDAGNYVYNTTATTYGNITFAFVPVIPGSGGGSSGSSSGGSSGSSSGGSSGSSSGGSSGSTDTTVPITAIVVGLTSAGVLGTLPVALYGPNVDLVTAGPGMAGAAPFVLNGQTGAWLVAYQPLPELTDTMPGVAQPIGYPTYGNGTLTVMNGAPSAEMASLYPPPAPPAVYGGPRRQFRQNRN